MVDNYILKIVGKTPLLQHNDNIEWSDAMEAWKNRPESKKLSKAGDDRTPPFRWIGCLYHEAGVITIPSENISRCLMEGGAMVLVPGGRSGKTFKAQTQSGIAIMGTAFPLLVRGKQIDASNLIAEAEAGVSEAGSKMSFVDHKLAARKIGFDLNVKRAKIGQAKHVRVRPIFDAWSVNVHVAVHDDQITQQVLSQIAKCAGIYKGLCDWRPGSRTPGQYGTFDVEVVPTKDK